MIELIKSLKVYYIKRKKKLTKEIYKQIFCSQKTNLIMNLDKQHMIIKSLKYAKIVALADVKNANEFGLLTNC